VYAVGWYNSLNILKYWSGYMKCREMMVNGNEAKFLPALGMKVGILVL
jgi:hypothetical protein